MKRNRDERAWPLEAFGRQVDGLTVADCTLLRALWAGADESARRNAWHELRQLLVRTRADEELQDLQERLVRWAGGEALRGVYPPFGVTSLDVRSNSQVRFDALPPLLDAAAAMLFADRLSAESAATLLDPWRTLRGEPPADADPAVAPEGS